MERDFDAERIANWGEPVTFTLRGEQFRLRRGIKPEAVLRWEAFDPKEQPEAEVLEVFDATLLACIARGDHERWKALRDADDDEPVTIAEMTSILVWALATLTGRPTERPSSSQDGAATTSNGSTSTSPSTTDGESTDSEVPAPS